MKAGEFLETVTADMANFPASGDREFPVSSIFVIKDFKATCWDYCNKIDKIYRLIILHGPHNNLKKLVDTILIPILVMR